MENPRPEKVAVVDEVREKFSNADAAVLTEYRGLNVPQMAALREALRESGGELKVYKNTLVRFAARDLGIEIEDCSKGRPRSRLRRGRPTSPVTPSAWPRSCASTPPITKPSSSKAVCSADAVCRPPMSSPCRRPAPRAVTRRVGRPHGCADAAIRQPARRRPARLRLCPECSDRKERIRLPPERASHHNPDELRKNRKCRQKKKFSTPSPG